MHTHAVARAVRGIEPLVAAEVRTLGRVRATRHREVWFETAEPGPGLLGLRTADDVLLVAAVVGGIGRDRSALGRLGRAAREIDVPSLMRLRRRITTPPRQAGVDIRQDAGPPRPAGVEVSASFVGRRNYTRFELEDSVGAALAAPLGLPYHSRRDGGVPPGGSVAWRVTVEDDQAVIALRVADRPLHRRPYKLGTVAGTLHPPVAAAMARLAGLDGAGVGGAGGEGTGGEGTGTVLDPCCGAGTTLIEAHALSPGARLLGVDRDPLALDIAAANAGRAASWASGLPGPFAWALGDAGRLPVPDGGVDRVLVNPPWGRQVAPAGSLARDAGLLWRETHRVLADDGIAVALLHEGAPGATGVPPGFDVERTLEVSLAGRHPVIAVLRKRPRPRRGGVP
ncbi:methyltransferase domain-containing protein [Nonomuraea sp. NPDC048916]|uniref:TRM11 family SAM-dependent methyltransferase n=1 Tax=Nonomuraea sp. NPDC048916 TaxID=3154232 RepID=UPI0034039080